MIRQNAGVGTIPDDVQLLGMIAITIMAIGGETTTTTATAAATTGGETTRPTMIETIRSTTAAATTTEEKTHRTKAAAACSHLPNGVLAAATTTKGSRLPRLRRRNVQRNLRRMADLQPIGVRVAAAFVAHSTSSTVTIGPWTLRRQDDD